MNVICLNARSMKVLMIKENENL